MEDLIDKAPPPGMPDKLYFRIGEVSRMVGVEPYVLRYWESEFPALAPKKTSAGGHRLYRRKDVALFFEIKRLLYERRFTIEGARRYLEMGKPGRRAEPETQGELFPATQAGPLAEVRRELQAILEILR